MKVCWVIYGGNSNPDPRENIMPLQKLAGRCLTNHSIAGKIWLKQPGKIWLMTEDSLKKPIPFAN
jgi:hypothetical protein